MMTATNKELREAFIKGAQWADDQCPVHAYPMLVQLTAQDLYPVEMEEVAIDVDQREA
jgi:hypothetical protein